MLFQPRPYDVLVIVPREDTDQALHDLGKSVQLEDFKFPRLRKLYPEKVKLVELLSKLEAFAEQLSPHGELGKRIDNPIEETETLIQAIESGLERIATDERNLTYRNRRLDAMLGLLDESEFIGSASLFSKSLEEWESYQSELQTRGVRIINSKDYEHEKLVLVKGPIQGYLGDAKGIQDALSKDISKIRTQVAALSSDKQKLSTAYGPSINTLKARLETEIELLEEKRMIAHSELFSFIRGVAEHKMLSSLPASAFILAEPKRDRKPGLANAYLKVIRNAISRKDA